MTMQSAKLQARYDLESKRVYCFEKDFMKSKISDWKCIESQDSIRNPGYYQDYYELHTLPFHTAV